MADVSAVDRRARNARSADPDLISAWGLLRSLLIYYGVPLRLQRLRAFYRQFVHAGDLCFDLGAHVGNRLRALAGLGARVVALEPHPGLYALLWRWYGRWPGVTVRGEAVGAEPGELPLLISPSVPTVSTVSADWRARVARDPGFAGVRWERQILVPVTTIDRLIEQFGLPRFCKLDVEGSEAQALRGLSTPLPGLSFEYSPAVPEIAHDCLEHLASLGTYEFNRTVGESTRWASPVWVDAYTLAAQLDALPPGSRSGDVYARLTGIT